MGGDVTGVAGTTATPGLSVQEGHAGINSP